MEDEVGKFYELGIVSDEVKKYKEVSQDIYDRLIFLNKCPGLTRREKRKLKKSEMRDLFNARRMSESLVKLRSDILVESITEQRIALTKRAEMRKEASETPQKKDADKEPTSSSLQAKDKVQTKSESLSDEVKKEDSKPQEKKANVARATC